MGWSFGADPPEVAKTWRAADVSEAKLTPSCAAGVDSVASARSVNRVLIGFANRTFDLKSGGPSASTGNGGLVISPASCNSSTIMRLRRVFLAGEPVPMIIHDARAQVDGSYLIRSRLAWTKLTTRHGPEQE